MKIPGTPNGVKSTAIPTPYANTDTRGAFGASFASTIDKVDNAVDSVQAAKARQDAADAAEAEKVRAQAYAISKANANAAYQRAETESVVGGTNRRSLIDQAFEGAADPTAADVEAVPGFFSTRGKEAYAKSGEVLEGLAKRREQLAKDHFADLADRERWLAESADLYAGTERRVEQHAAQQFEVARKDALQGIVASSLEQIASVKDGAELQIIAENAEKHIRELQVSEEGGNEDIDRFRRDAIEVRIDSLLRDGDVKQARGQYASAKALLGTKADNVNARIVAAEKAQVVQANDVEAQRIVDSVAESGTSPDGKPDFEVMDALLKKLPPGPVRDEVEKRLPYAKEKLARSWKQRVDRYADAASSTYEKTRSLGAVDPKVKSWLIDKAPDEWKKLRKDAEADIARWTSERNGDAAARRAQAEVDRLARLEFMEKSPAERATANVTEFLRGRGVSPIGASTVKGEQTKAVETVRAGDAMGEQDFVRKYEAATRGLAPDGKAGDTKRRDLRAVAVEAYADLRAKNKGIKPSSEDVDEEIKRLSVKAATEPRALEFIRGKGVETEAERLVREKRERAKDRTPTAQDAAALEWLRANPDHPRADAIRKKLGVK